MGATGPSTLRRNPMTNEERLVLANECVEKIREAVTKGNSMLMMTDPVLAATILALAEAVDLLRQVTEGPESGK